MILSKYTSQVNAMFNTSLGFDLGTSFFRVFQPGKGVVAEHPHVVAIDKSAQKVVGIGQEAQDLIGKVTGNITVMSPFDRGVMSAYSVSEGLYRHLFHQILGKFFLLKPLVMSSVASDATPVERQAISEAMFAAGARQVYLIDSPLASAIGAGVPVAESSGNIVVYMGGGITEVAVISLGSIVKLKSVRVGGNDLDRAVQSMIRKKYAVAISLDTAREIKERFLDLRRSQAKHTFEIKAKDLSTGYPKEVLVSATEVLPALEKPLKVITQSIHQFLEEIPAELASDVIDKGVILTGGGAKLAGYDFCLSQMIGVPVSMAEEPERCVIKGVQLALENLDLYRQSLAFESLG